MLEEVFRDGLQNEADVLGLGPGDVLWGPPITFVASTNCALYCGASVDFVDVDPLTANIDPDKLEQRLAEEISKARRYCFQLSVLLFDLDHFKRINDAHGHQVGDQMLIEVSALTGEQLRESDLLARYGGEEFLVIAPNTGPAEAAMLAERLRAAIEAHDFLEGHADLGERGLHITISIGLASFDDDNVDSETLIGNADRNLYQAKHAGRNRVVGNPVPATNAAVTAVATRVG